MPHEILIDRRFVEIVHTGQVSYADRLAALAEVTKSQGSKRLLPVLINFDQAMVVEESKEARADYIARATLHPFFYGRRVAMTGVSLAEAQPAAAAAAAKQIPFRLFESRDEALFWLIKAVAAPPPKS